MIMDEDGNKIDELLMVDGARYRRYSSTGGYIEFTHCNIDTTIQENEWVMSELMRTDELVKLPDYPHMSKVLQYRAALRTYDLNGVRPETPTTDGGNSI